MIFKVFIDKDLGHVSYIIGDEKSKEIMIVDPRRDVEDYVNFIENNDLTLKYIFNSHTHADYVGGHLELVDKYKNAKNIFFKSTPLKFEFLGVKEGDVLEIGKLKLKILETPGHTPFCISGIINEDEVDKIIFTGDFLFVGDIGRPDLLGKEKIEELANLSFESAQKLWNLSDDLIVFTTHIQGSLCGKNLKNQYFSTIGIEKKTNKTFALSQNKERYIQNLLNKKIETPLFFKKMAKINIKGPNLLKNIESIKFLNKEEFFKEVKDEDYIIDFRHSNCFKNGYIKGSINGYEFSNIQLIIGSLIDIDNRLFLVGDRKTNFREIVKKLKRIGFDNIEAILKNDVNELDNLIKFEEDNDFSKKIINLEIEEKTGDINIEISKIPLLELDKDFFYEVICKNGYKSMAVATFLLRKGVMAYA